MYILYFYENGEIFSPIHTYYYNKYENALKAQRKLASVFKKELGNLYIEDDCFFLSNGKKNVTIVIELIKTED